MYNSNKGAKAYDTTYAFNAWIESDPDKVSTVNWLHEQTANLMEKHLLCNTLIFRQNISDVGVCHPAFQIQTALRLNSFVHRQSFTPNKCIKFSLKKS